MTISSTDAVRRATGNGVTTAFPGPYILQAADLVVFLDGVIQASGFTTTGIGEGSGCTVTFSTAPTTETLGVVLLRTPAQIQPAVYAEGARFPAVTHEKEQDRGRMIDQDLLNRISHTIRTPIYETAVDELPAAAARAGKAVVFNGAGALALGTISSSDIGKQKEWRLDVSAEPFNALPNATTAPEIAACQTAVDAALAAASAFSSIGIMVEVYFPGLAHTVSETAITDTYQAWRFNTLNIPNRVRVTGDGLASRLQQAPGLTTTFVTMGTVGSHLSWADLCNLWIDCNWANSSYTGDVPGVFVNGVKLLIADVTISNVKGVGISFAYDGGDAGRSHTPSGSCPIIRGLVVKNCTRQTMVFNGPSDAFFDACEWVNGSQEVTNYAVARTSPNLPGIDAVANSPYFRGEYASVLIKSACKIVNSHIHVTSHRVGLDGVNRVSIRPLYSLAVEGGAIIKVSNCDIEGGQHQFFAVYDSPGSHFSSTRFYSTAGGPAIYLLSGLHSFAACHVAGPIGSTAEAGNTYPEDIVGIRIGHLTTTTATLDCSTNPNYPAGVVGVTIINATVSGKVGGASGKAVTAGNRIICTRTNAGGTEASVGKYWQVVDWSVSRPVAGVEWDGHCVDCSAGMVDWTGDNGDATIDIARFNGAYADLSPRPTEFDIGTPNASSQNLGVTRYPSIALTATGTTKTDALLLAANRAAYVITGGAGTTGVKFAPRHSAINGPVRVLNKSGSDKAVYPADDAAATTALATLPDGMSGHFWPELSALIGGTPTWVYLGD